MKELSRALGQRLRNYRVAKGLSQEALSELAGCHPTYIGQLERGEKNATVESLSKVSAALGISLSELFLQPAQTMPEAGPAMRCYELLAKKPLEEQEQLYQILLQLEAYKSM